MLNYGAAVFCWYRWYWVQRESLERQRTACYPLYWGAERCNWRLYRVKISWPTSRLHCKRNWGEGWRRLLLLDPIQPGGHWGEIGKRHVSCFVSTFCCLCLSVFSLWIFWRSWRSFPSLVFFLLLLKLLKRRAVYWCDNWWSPLSPCACVSFYRFFSNSLSDTGFQLVPYRRRKKVPMEIRVLKDCQ